MKRSHLFLIALLSIFLLSCTWQTAEASPVMADTTANVTADKQKDALLISYPTTSVPSVAVHRYSNWFTIQGYNGVDFSTSQINYTKLLTSDTAKPRITTIFEGTNDLTNVYALDTLGIVADSIETAQKGVLNLNSANGSNHFYYYRIHQKAEAGGFTDNPADATAQTELLFINPNK